MSIQKDFESHFMNQTDIWKSFQNKALALAFRSSTKRISSKYIIESIRNDNDMKIDNRFTSRYARLFVDKYPEHAHRFELRPLLTD